MKHFAITYPDGLTINAQFNEVDAQKIGTLSNQISNGYSWYHLPNVEKAQIGISACFFAGKLVHINLAKYGAEFGSSWDDFTEEKEKSRVKVTKQWLNKNGLKTGAYSWGTVDCNYDQKAARGYAAIWLFCNQNQFLGQPINMDEFAALRQLMINTLSAFSFKKNGQKSFIKLIGFSEQMLNDTYQGFPETKNAAQSLLVVQNLLTFVLENEVAETKQLLFDVQLKKPQLRALLTKFSA